MFYTQFRNHLLGNLMVYIYTDPAMFIHKCIFLRSADVYKYRTGLKH